MSQTMTPREAALKIRDLRDAWPNPCSCPKDDSDYCVGGALARGTLGFFTGWYAWLRNYWAPGNGEFTFPTSEGLAGVLQQYNPALTDAWAEEFANRIIDHNDCNKFPAAWLDAEVAFHFVPGPMDHGPPFLDGQDDAE